MKKLSFILFLFSLVLGCNNGALIEDDSDFESIKNSSQGLQERKFEYIDDLDGGYDDGGRCFLRCVGKGSDCSNFNPGVCGSVCQMRTTVNILAIDEETEDISDDLLNIFPSLYNLRNTLDDYNDGKDLVDNYYKIGNLYISGQVEISLGNQLNAALAILGKANLISEFVNNKTSSSIFVTSSDVSDFKDLIDDFRQDSNNTEYNQILDYFESKLDEIENKPISQIYSIL